MFIDTHCHIHEIEYPLDGDVVLKRAHEADVDELICVGTSEQSSEAALAFAARHENVFAAIGVHPHDTKDGYGRMGLLAGSGLDFAPHAARKLVAIGEIGLDYFYTHSPREVQIEALEAQMQLALDHGLPIIFHVREAFDDFWPLFDNFSGIRGELHSFTDSEDNLGEALKRGLSIGVNGISTFTKDTSQKHMFLQVPLEKMLLETDAPFLTPVPFRGKVNEPAFVRQVAEFHAKSRGITVAELGQQTSANARALFAL